MKWPWFTTKPLERDEDELDGLSELVDRLTPKRDRKADEIEPGFDPPRKVGTDEPPSWSAF